MLRADNPYYWELIESVQAFQLDRYAKPVATLFDSTSVTDELHHFQVIAHGTGGGLWISPPASGRSLDNLAPAAPLSLVAVRDAQEVDLEWSPSDEFEEDFLHYTVYRSESS
ncbi:MAG: hypothetical protein KAT30_07530, partial [Candidatus Krumholzibacteria bacterium]|nr:hypothetical protein [Candidatus Krumholzibacteria bacterium]